MYPPTDAPVGKPEPLLDIVIPTFNRLAFLKDTLASLCESYQKARSKFAEEVRILIWDGGSQDGTPQWLAEHQTEYSFRIEAIQTARPVPYGERLLGFLKHSTARYVWYFSDDDRVVEDAISTILGKLIGNGIPGAVLVNYSQWSFGFEELFVARTLDLTQMGLTGDPEGVVRAGQHLGFLPALIVSRDLALQVSVPPAIVRGAWPHVVPFLHCARISGVQVVEDPLVQQRSANSHFGRPTSGKSWHQTFVEEWGELCDYCPNMGFSRKATALLRSAPIREGNLGSRRILGERMHNIPQPPNLLALCLREYWYVPRFYWGVLPGLLIPRFGARLLYRLGCYIKGKCTSLL